MTESVSLPLLSSFAPLSNAHRGMFSLAGGCWQTAAANSGQLTLCSQSCFQSASWWRRSQRRRRWQLAGGAMGRHQPQFRWWLRAYMGNICVWNPHLYLMGNLPVIVSLHYRHPWLIGRSRQAALPPSAPVHDQGNVPHITFLNGQLRLPPSTLLRRPFVVCVCVYIDS